MLEQLRSECISQNRVIALFNEATRADCLGFRYLGDRHDNENNRPVENDILSENLKRRDKTRALKQVMKQVLLTGRTRLL